MKKTVILGAGIGGLSAAAALKSRGIDNFAVCDKAPDVVRNMHNGLQYLHSVNFKLPFDFNFKRITKTEEIWNIQKDVFSKTATIPQLFDYSKKIMENLRHPSSIMDPENNFDAWLPMNNDLIFERFIDINREDLPDIDVDFEDDRRDDVVNYMKQKYGKEHIAAISTFTTFKGKNTIQDLGRIYKIPFKVVNDIKKLVIERSGGDSRASFTIEDTFEQFELAQQYLQQYPELKYASALEGQIRNGGCHASGVLVSKEPITNFCAFYKNKGLEIASLDYTDASELGLTKIDFLGLNTLTSIAKATKMIRERTGKTIDIYSVNLEDPKVYEGFNDPKKLFGIFQFDGQATNQVCRQAKPKNFKELTAINALSRPGPMHGLDPDYNEPITSIYIARKLGKMSVKYAHPLLEPITKNTFGVVIYQEQVMKVMREIGKMSWEDTAEIRKAISKSKGVEAFNAYKKKFAIGAKENGLTDFEIDDIWSSVCSHGSWCISGDTKVRICGQNGFVKNKLITIEQLYKNNGYATPKWKYQPDAYKKVKILSIDFDGRIKPARIKNIYYNGMRETREIITENEKRIKATLNHRFLTNNGYTEVSKLKVGNLIAVNGGYEPKEYIKTQKGKGWIKGLKWKNGKQPILDGRNKEIELFKKKKLGQSCDHCSEYHKRMEVHHITHNAPNSIMEWLCPSCHKIIEYKKGRIKVWQKGFVVKFEKIKRIAKYKNKKRAHNVYDIEMEDNSKPNFIANDFVSHNSFNKSHSVSYSIISYLTMWLKVYYPIEYYCAMTSTMNNENKIKRVIKEYIREGFKLLSVNINKSKASFVIDDESLRLGFSQIKGIGNKFADDIVKNQPYSNIEDFKSRCGNKNKQIQLLNKLGAFDEIGGANKTLHTLFGDVIEDKYESNIDFEEKIKICPYIVDFNIFENWNDFIKKNIKFKADKIENVNEEINSQVIVGIIYDKNIKDKIEEALTRGKPAPSIRPGEAKYCNFLIEDDTDFVTVRVANRNFNQFKKLIFENTATSDIIMVKGKMGDGIRMFFANEIICLNHLKNKLEGNLDKSFTESELVLMGKMWRNIPRNGLTFSKRKSIIKANIVTKAE